jgi:hypothetical protein
MKIGLGDRTLANVQQPLSQDMTQIEENITRLTSRLQSSYEDANFEFETIENLEITCGNIR